MINNRILRKAEQTSALLAVLFVNSTFGAAVSIDPRTTVTASMDGGTAKTGNTWYGLGVNTASAASGLVSGLVFGQSDPLSTYLFQPAAGLNSLMLDNATKTGTITFGRPLSVTALSFAGSSGNGAGSVTPTLRFTDSTSDTLGAVTFGDWFNNTPRVETANGRIDVGANSFANVGSDNPRILAINLTLSAADAAKTIRSIDLTWTGGTTVHTAIFGVSGDIAGLGHFSAIPLLAASFNQDMIVGLSEVVPEPGTLALFSFGAIGLVVSYRRKRF